MNPSVFWGVCSVCSSEAGGPRDSQGETSPPPAVGAGRGWQCMCVEPSEASLAPRSSALPGPHVQLARPRTSSGEPPRPRGPHRRGRAGLACASWQRCPELGLCQSGKCLVPRPICRSPLGPLPGRPPWGPGRVLLPAGPPSASTAPGSPGRVAPTGGGGVTRGGGASAPGHP